MSVSIVNRTPPLLQKSAKRSQTESGHQSVGSGDIVMHMQDYGSHQPGTGEAVDKKA